MTEDAAYVHELLRTRRSIRKFKPDPISQETLERIMASACWAPSAMDRQPWKFYVLMDEMRDRLATLHQPVFQRMEQAIRDRYGEEGIDLRRRLYMNLGGAPVAIVCFTEKKEENADRDKVSAALACQNLVISAWAEGLGGLMMGSSMHVQDEISFLCGVDSKKMALVVVILLGYPDEQPDPPERRKKRVVYASTPADIRNQ